MQNTTATYLVSVTTEDEEIITFYRTMPTRPTTQRGRIAQKDRLTKWAMKEYPNWHEIDIQSSTAP